MFLSREVEPHRDLIELSTAHLSRNTAQLIAYEVIGVYEAVEAKKRPEIGNLKSWLAVVVESAERGEFEPQWGKAIKQKHEARLRHERKKSYDDEIVRIERQSLDLRMQVAQEALKLLSPELLDELQVKIASDMPNKDIAKRVVDNIRQRLLPAGLGCIQVVEALEDMSRLGGKDACIV